MIPQPLNGKTQIIAWLVGIIQAITLTYLFWSGSAIVEAKTEIATLKANYQSIDRRLTEIQQSLTRLEDRP